MTQSEWILKLFPKPGFFVEAGAHDGVGDSNTYALEQAGWTGICVEPSGAFALLQKSRHCAVDNRCLWRADGEQVRFRQCEDIELSGIVDCFGDHWDRSRGKESLMATVSLPTLLVEHQAPAVIEYLSLDTEGSELEILSAHDFARYLFLAIGVEHNGVAARRAALRALLTSRGYRLDAKNSWEVEDWFIHRTLESPP